MLLARAKRASVIVCCVVKDSDYLLGTPSGRYLGDLAPLQGHGRVSWQRTLL